MRTCILALVAAIIIFQPSFANIIHVPGYYPSIQTGINASQNGDTVLVAPGTYQEHVDFGRRVLSLISESGSDQTIIDGSGATGTTISIRWLPAGPDSARLIGFTIRGGGDAHTVEISYNSSAVSIRNNVFHSNIVGVMNNRSVVRAASRARIERNLFYDNGGVNCVVSDADVRIINNTMDSNNRGIYSHSSLTVVMNNIVTNSVEYGIGGSYGVNDYNDAWNNGSANYPGPNGISLDPQYVYPAEVDYNLGIGSPCIDAGNPDPSYDDPDGTTNDMGAFYINYAGSNIAWIDLGSGDLNHVVDNVPVISWGLFDTTFVQASYEIEVGTDIDWTVADLWATGEVMSSDSSALYEGAALVDGHIYYIRIRVSDGTEWRHWRSSRFRMNSVPGVPQLESPINGDSAPAIYTRLAVQNAVDPDGDNHWYDFEVYGNPELTDLVQAQNGVPEGPETTSSNAVSGLVVGGTYWWRARATDGFEYSPWSAPESFAAGQVQTIHVPEDYPTIHDAIDNADPVANIIVGPGSYEENIDYSGKALKISGAGAALTNLRPSNLGRPAVTITNGETGMTGFSGFTVSGGDGYDLILVENGAAPLISKCVFRDFHGYKKSDANSVVMRITSDATITRNVFYNNEATACIAVTGDGRADIINNTIMSSAQGIYCGSGKARAVNNIITYCWGYGVYGSFEQLDYNCVWNNNPNYDGYTTFPGEHDIQADPLYFNLVTHDYALTLNSPCIDAGDPAGAYNDPDGSRNDMGAFALDVSTLPWAVGVNLSPDEYDYNIINHTPAFYWSYQDLSNPQQAFQIEVGSDLDWTSAEMWNSGTVTTTDTSITYDGLPLEDGMTYYARIRVFNGVTWGRWSDLSFRMNYLPDMPVLYAPDDQGNLSIYDMRLGVYTSANLDEDPVVYDFEIYADESLTQPVFIQNNVHSGDTYTFSDYLYGLKQGSTYWWRARLHDIFEHSEWSGPWSFTYAWGQTHHVPEDFPTIQGAITAADDGDAIIVAKGSYAENLDFGGKYVKVIGVDSEYTFLSPANPDSAAVYFRNGEGTFAEIAGFTISGGWGTELVQITNGSHPVIKKNIFRDYATDEAHGMVIRVISDAIIVDNLFRNNGGISCIGLTSGATGFIANNTFDHNNRGFHSGFHRGIAINNIITNSNDYGIYGDFATLDYNCVWNNHPNYDGGAAAGGHSISQDPLYLAPDYWIYAPSLASPCVDAGNPLPQYNDDDGSRGNMGAFSMSDYALPLAVNVGWPGEDSNHVICHMCDIVWIFLDASPENSQAAYEIQVGTDDDWSVAEMWATGEVASADTSALYVGGHLDNGQTYFMRVRLSDGDTWGGWRQFRFRMNTEPTVPAVLWPPGGTTVDALDAYLSVTNSTDAENDTLVYSFEVYNTRDIHDIAASVEDIPEDENYTASGQIPNLDFGHWYWWRARSFDGHEYSRWTPFDSFMTGGATTIRVPQDMPTIQAAIDVAADGNVVLVSPGEYIENINFNGKRVFLRSSDGPDVTTLMSQFNDRPMIVIESGDQGRAEISGFTLTGPVGWGGSRNAMVRIADSSAALITNNIFRNSEATGDAPEIFLIETEYSSTTIKRNVFYHNYGAGCIYAYGDDVTIENNTFDRNYRGLKITGTNIVVKNNIITRSFEYGIYGRPALPNCDYNCVWFNHPDYDGDVTANAHSISENPLYVDYLTSNYRLSPGSPCINAGDPEMYVPYYGGTAIDMGAYEYYLWLGGDANIDGNINIADAIYIINYIFKGGPPPDQLAFADCNADCTVNVADAVLLIQYIFQNGPWPVMGCAYQYEMNDDSASSETK